MMPALNVRVVELLCSRLCHDLVSPVGAISNGMELIEEARVETGEGIAGNDSDMLGEALDLIALSASQAARRLTLFRFAYGTAGTLARDFGEARRAAEGWLRGGRTSLDWDANQPPPSLAGRLGIMKMLMNLIVLADECLPQGGVVHVSGSGNAEVGMLRVSASGPALRLLAETRDTLQAPLVEPETLTPRTIHAFITRCFAAHYAMHLRPLMLDDSGTRMTAEVVWQTAP